VDLDGSAGTSYRVDDLAHLTGVTVRNIRAYQERGLLHHARRVGRVSLYDDTHVARLRIITSMLDRGYTSAPILELLAAWEGGRDLADVLGLDHPLAPPRREPGTAAGGYLAPHRAERSRTDDER
jgi:DNA-binding transcriptional MerR regulator